MKKYIIIVFILFFFIFYFSLPYFLKVKIKDIPKSTIIYDSNNIEIGEIISEEKYRHIDLEDYPDFLKKSLLAIEDKRFYFHSGIDYFGIIRAIFKNISGEKIQGASTIENQIIRNNYWLNEKRTFLLKIKEFLYSLNLNKKYSKNEILNIYLNNVNFGYLNYGFESASRFYYGKSINKNTKAEMIGLVTIIKNPNLYNPINQKQNFDKRFILIVNSLEKNLVISSKEKQEILDEKINFGKNNIQKLPYIVDYLKNTQKNILSNSSKIFTTIDYNLTKKVEELSFETLKKLSWKDVGDYGVIIIDKKTMDLKVMIGGINYKYENGQVNSTLALRQPGSTLKPFIYLLAFQNLSKTPSSTILDLPVQFPTYDGNIYAPQNYSLSYAGEVSLAESLSQSINIPAIKLLNEVGINNFLLFLKKVLITTLNKNSDYYGLSIGLGSGEVSLYELTRSYSLFALDGQVCDIKILKGQEKKCFSIIDKKYTSMVYDILTNRYFKLAGFPINSNLDFQDREVFLKTGTSRNFKDNWTIGFNRDFLIGVWVGNKDGQEMKGVSGADGAGEIFRKIIYLLDEKTYNPIPKNIEKNSKNYIKIVSPLDKSIFKIDLNTPISNQTIKLSFDTNINYDEKIWYLNGEKVKENFLEIFQLKQKNIIKVDILKNGKIIGNDESKIELNNE